jgi:dCMP deaminase
MLINSSVKRIVFRDGYPDQLAQEMLQEAGVELVRWSPSEGA